MNELLLKSPNHLCMLRNNFMLSSFVHYLHIYNPIIESAWLKYLIVGIKSHNSVLLFVRPKYK